MGAQAAVASAGADGRASSQSTVLVSIVHLPEGQSIVPSGVETDFALLLVGTMTSDAIVSQEGGEFAESLVRSGLRAEEKESHAGHYSRIAG